MSIWKQERIDGVVREIERKSLQDIAIIILEERFDRRVKGYEAEWLDTLATTLRNGDSFNEVEMCDEMFRTPKRELTKRYKNE
jgi:hypothetical protein